MSKRITAQQVEAFLDTLFAGSRTTDERRRYARRATDRAPAGYGCPLLASGRCPVAAGDPINESQPCRRDR